MLTHENLIWDQAELMPRAELPELQLQRLRETVAQCAGVPYYRAAFKHERLSADSLRTLEDLRRLPITTKDDLREHPLSDFLAVPRGELARIHGSSGSTGVPTFVAYTADDLVLWSNMCARFLTAGGLRPEHTVHISFGYGMFTGGFGLHYGVERVGAAVVPAAAGNTGRHVVLLQELQPQVLVGTPSYSLQIAETAREMGVEPRDLSLELAFFGGEPWTEHLRAQIERELGLTCFNNYGLSELLGPGMSGECPAREGMHFQEDHFLVECVDPATLEPVPDGEPGELVITNLSKQAMRMVRYRTRDLASLDRSPCPCGRTGVRMSRVTGRTDDMLIIRGVNIFPSQIEEALLRVEGTAPHYLIEVDRPAAMDELTISVEVRPEVFSDRMADMQALRERLDREIYRIASLRAHVNLVAPQTLERSSGKARRVIDHRREKGLI